MNSVTLALTLASIACLPAQESPPPPEIAAALVPIAETEAKAAAAKEKRIESYVADLAKLEKSVAKDTGDLQAVLSVRTEKETWAKGAPTPAIDPKDESKPLALRKLRFYFDRDLANLETQAKAAMAEARNLAKSRLKALEVRFTKEREIGLALAARQAGANPDPALDPTPKTAPKPETQTKPGIPRLPPGIRVPFVNRETGSLRMWGKNHAGEDMAKTLPRTGQFVQVAASDGAWLALARNGDCLWKRDFTGAIEKTRTYKFEDIRQIQRGFFLRAIDKRGRFCSTTRREGRFRLVDGGHATSYQFHKNGEVTFGGVAFTRKQNPAPKPPLTKLQNVTDVRSGVSSTVFIREDDTGFGWAVSSGEFPVDTGGERIVYLDGGYACVGGLSETGRVFFWSGVAKEAEFLSERIPLERGPFTALRVANKLAAARTIRGKWIAWGDNAAGLVDRIHSLENVKDLDFATKPGANVGWVIWIE